MRISSQAEGTVLDGQFRVACAHRPDGPSYVSAQYVSAPFHFSKPYWTGEALVVQAVNVTAGVLAGDRLTMEVAVREGARVLLTSPSAHRVHTMRGGRAAMEQVFRVAAGGWLEVLPELFIPQARCRYRQATRIDVEAGGELFFAETLAPGRVAHGERYAFEDVSWSLDLHYAGRLLVRERYVLRADDTSTWSLRHPFATGYYAGCYVVSERAGDLASARDDVHALADGARLTGMTQLAPACWVLKVLAADSETLRATLRAIRARFAEVLPALRADARKL